MGDLLMFPELGQEEEEKPEVENNEDGRPVQRQCPRCQSTNTKFCYYNNYSKSQPRHYCKECNRYWTQGGSLRNIPFGGTTRKRRSKRSIHSTQEREPQQQVNPAAMLAAPVRNKEANVVSTAKFASILPTSSMYFPDETLSPLSGIRSFNKQPIGGTVFSQLQASNIPVYGLQQKQQLEHHQKPVGGTTFSQLQASNSVHSLQQPQQQLQLQLLHPRAQIHGSNAYIMEQKVIKPFMHMPAHQAWPLMRGTNTMAFKASYLSKAADCSSNNNIIQSAGASLNQTAFPGRSGLGPF